MGNIPICRECAFLVPRAACAAVGSASVDLVLGDKLYPNSAYDERSPSGSCGPEGKNFIQRVIWFGSQREGM